MQDIFGIIDSKGAHVDVAATLQGAKNYATRHNYRSVSVRFNCGYHAEIVAVKHCGKWYKPDNVPATIDCISNNPQTKQVTK